MGNPASEARKAAKLARIKAIADIITLGEMDKVKAGLQAVAAHCDGARSWDGAGFSKVDVAFGKRLAFAQTLGKREAAAGVLLLNKYRRQLGDGAIYDAVAHLMERTKPADTTNEEA